jgi:hypothetical protein
LHLFPESPQGDLTTDYEKRRIADKHQSAVRDSGQAFARIRWRTRPLNLAWHGKALGVNMTRAQPRTIAGVRIGEKSKDCWVISMRPTRDQIERAAYDRWLRRHRAHGHDRNDWVGAENELLYVLNYQTLVEYPLDASSTLVLGGDRPRQCRFCERIARHTAFSGPREVVQGAVGTTLLSAQVCDECQSDCRDPLALHCERFWQSLCDVAATHSLASRHIDLLAVFKSLVTSAMLIMPEQELAYFTDTLEWLNNPDHEYDAGLFAGTCCHVYRAPFDNDRTWARLARRIDDEAPFPYMVCFLGWGGIVVQISVPLCIRDHDLDGRSAHLPVRSLVAGEGSHYRETGPAMLRLVDPASRVRALGRRALLLK